MAYLAKRVARFVDDIRRGRLKLDYLPAQQRAEIEVEIGAVRLLADGTADLSTCSPHLRSIARAYSAASHHLEEKATSAPRPTGTTAFREASVSELNRDLFLHFREIFEGFTGASVDDFVPAGSEFGEAIRALGERLKANRGFAVERFGKGQQAIAALQSHYSRAENVRLLAARDAGGMKFVLGGGSSSFSQSSVAATRSMLLYCDAVLIPDPVLPWLEVARSEERFANVRMLENIFSILKLAPLIDAELPEVPIIVFPSWEKSLEERDEATRDGQELMALRFFSHFCDAKFEDLREVMAYATTEGESLLATVEKHSLYVAAGGKPGERLGDAIRRQRAEYERYRQGEHLELLRAASDAELVATGILERLAPQFHATDNAESLRASPLFSLPVQWHYFRLLQRASGIEPEVSSSAANTAAALTQDSLKWLGNVPVPDLIELRKRMENGHFRSKIGEYVAVLGDAASADGPRVAREVERGISALLVEHQNEVRRIAEEYERKHTTTMVAGWLTLAASFATMLPFEPALVTGAGALGLLAKYLGDKGSEVAHHRQHRRTLLGALAAAKAGT